MRRIFTLAWFIAKDFFRSWQSFVPLTLALTFYGLAFQYGATPAYFAAVTPVAMIVITIVTVLLLAGRTGDFNLDDLAGGVLSAHCPPARAQ